VKQPAFLALVASAFVLYLVASAGAYGVSLDAGSWALAGVALWSALLPLWVKRDSLSQAPDLVRALGLLFSLTLASALAVPAHSLLGELVFLVCLPLLAFVTLHLSVFAPDTPTRLARHVGSMSLVRVFAVAAALLGALAALPPIWLAGRAIIFPVAFLRAPIVFALAAFALSWVLRVFRRRLGSDTRALSSNVWPSLGLSLGLGLSLVSLALFWLSLISGQVLRVTLALGASVFLLGHLWLVSTHRARVAHAWARELSALGFSLALAAGVMVLLARQSSQSGSLWLVAGLLFVLVFELGKSVFRRLAVYALAPQRGELLAAVTEIRRETAAALSYAELGAGILRPLRRAAGSPEAAPLLHSFHPMLELRLDAAGFARASGRALSEVLRKRLESAPEGPIVRADLRQVLSRRPELRTLVWALDELNALCVLPLVTDGVLDGALVVAQGTRRDPLSLEELDALEGLTRFIAPLLATMAKVERLASRVSAGERDQKEASERLRDAAEELVLARSELSLLRASATPLHAYRDPINYSPAMRSLCARLLDVAAQDVPLTLAAEVGTPTLSLAAYVHKNGGRSEGPFLVADCAQLDQDAMARIFGSSEASETLGLLSLAQTGTLVLENIVGLPLDTQRALANALAARRASPAGSSSWYAVDARLIATVRRPLEALIAQGALCAELARWLRPVSYNVPPLRECREDLESLTLLALDRAGRVLGKNVPGLAPEALAALKDYPFPLNHYELELLIERAVADASGLRVELMDLPPLPRGNASLGSFLDQERDILRRALEQAGGNRTRAARALGLKRTTLIEKLRRLGLDEGRSGTEH
jgi:DNA-binding NtrC family response regulator